MTKPLIDTAKLLGFRIAPTERDADGAILGLKLGAKTGAVVGVKVGGGPGFIPIGPIVPIALADDTGDDAAAAPSEDPKDAAADDGDAD